MMWRRISVASLVSGCLVAMLRVEETRGQLNFPQFPQQGLGVLRNLQQQTPGQLLRTGVTPFAPPQLPGVTRAPQFPGFPQLPATQVPAAPAFQTPGTPFQAPGAPAVTQRPPPPLPPPRPPVSQALQNVQPLGSLGFSVPQIQQPQIPQTANLQDMTNTIGQINQQIANLRNQLATAGARTSPGLSLLQSQTTPAILQEGTAALQALQQTVERVNRGQGQPVSDIIYPPAILTILQGATAQPRTSTGAAVPLCAERRPPCNLPDHVRSIDGTCNNLRQSHWGRADSPLIRLLPSNYDDGILQPRSRGRDGTPLPSARLVSSRCTSVAENVASGRWTLSVMQWGQFIDHDLTHVPVQRLNVTSGVDCCSDDVTRENVRQLPECLPIDVPADDPFYSRFNVRCMNFLRSIPALGDGCGERPAQQVNQITHWLDGSNVYGSSAAELAQLRRGGSRLMLTSRDGRLPRMQHGNEGCAQNNGVCFRAGDTRVNEQISLTAIHNVWVMMHNRIAGILGRLNPQASEEDLFQESRAVNVALMQHVIYAEWLPVVLGPAVVRRLRLDQPGRYRADIHPGIVNEFAAAAFRFGHSLVAGFINLPGRSRSLRLSDVFFNPGAEMQQRGMLLALIRGLVSQPSEQMDTTFSQEIVGLLFRGERQHGLDLVALNIQRGRDHGIGTYSQVWAALQTACPALGAAPTRWEHLNDAMSPDRVAAIRSVYRSVEDIDLFVGGMAEDAAEGALLGPLFQCLLAEQFTRLKYADRHFYNHDGSMFTDAQLDAIDSMTWSAVLCEVFPQLGRVQDNGFLIGGRERRCRRTFTMEAWRDVLPRR